MGGLLQPVDPIAPVAPVPSILTTARALPSSIDWKSGIQWRPTIKPGSVDTAVDDIVDLETCPTPTDLTAETWDPTDLGSALPVLARLPYECEEVLPGQVGQFRDEATAALTAATAWFVSDYVTSALNAVDSPVGGSALHPVAALARLLAAYLDCTYLGGPIVSVPPLVVPSLLGSGAVKQVGDQYVGPMGSLINPGPAGIWDGGAGTATMFVSGPIEFALGPVTLPLGEREAFWDRTMNLFRIEAQRSYIARFDPGCVFSADAYLPEPTQGEGVT